MDIGGRTGHERTRVVFVESLARVRRVSLSARVVRWCVDRLLVQWEELRGQGEVVGLVVVDGELDR
jgi:beta-1,4-N-acetylglucosaminyltransferase